MRPERNRLLRAFWFWLMAAHVIAGGLASLIQIDRHFVN